MILNSVKDLVKPIKKIQKEVKGVQRDLFTTLNIWHKRVLEIEDQLSEFELNLMKCIDDSVVTIDESSELTEIMHQAKLISERLNHTMEKIGSMSEIVEKQEKVTDKLDRNVVKEDRKIKPSLIHTQTTKPSLIQTQTTKPSLMPKQTVKPSLIPTQTIKPSLIPTQTIKPSDIMARERAGAVTQQVSQHSSERKESKISTEQQYLEVEVPEGDPPSLSDKHKSGRSYRSILTDITVNFKLLNQIDELLAEMLNLGKRVSYNNQETLILERYDFIFNHPRVWQDRLNEEKKRAMEMKSLLNS